jgi:hypothetical protein
VESSSSPRPIAPHGNGEEGLDEMVCVGPRNNRVQLRASTQDHREMVAVCRKANAQNAVYLVLFDGQHFVECRFAHLRFFEPLKRFIFSFFFAKIVKLIANLHKNSLKTKIIRSLKINENF